MQSIMKVCFKKRRWGLLIVFMICLYKFCYFVMFLAHWHCYRILFYHPRGGDNQLPWVKWSPSLSFLVFAKNNNNTDWAKQLSWDAQCSVTKHF